VYTNTRLRIYTAGGGKGALDPETENTIIFDKDFRVVGGTLRKTYKFTYDPETREWTGTILED
jgi:hypothetical protein